MCKLQNYILLHTIKKKKIQDIPFIYLYSIVCVCVYYRIIYTYFVYNKITIVYKN